MKSFLIALAVLVSYVPAHADLLLEPYAGYYFGDSDDGTSKDDVTGPGFGANAFDSSELFKDLGQRLLSVWGQVYGVTDGGVNNPAEDDLACVPTAVALEEFLEGNGFIPV